MRPLLSLQSFRTAGTKKCRLQFPWSSSRMLTTTSACFEEANAPSPPSSERQKGIPQAFELGGVSISSHRPSLAQRLRSRRSSAANSSAAPSELSIPEGQARSEGEGVPLPKPRAHGPRDTPFSGLRRPQEKRNDYRQQGRPVERSGHSRTRHAGQESSPRDRPNRTAQAQQRRGRTRSPGRSQGGQERGKLTSPRQSKGKGGARRPGSQKQKGKGKGKTVLARKKRVTDPEMTDYPDEDWNRPPVRRFDARGVLRLRSKHVQISPIPRPSVGPFLAPEATLITTALRPLSYTDRAQICDRIQPSERPESVIGNANLALSRVRELRMPERRDALYVVEKMAKTGNAHAKEVTTVA